MGNPGNGIGNTGVSVGAIGIAGSDILSVMPLMRISRKGILLEREKSTIDWSVSDQFLLVSNSLEASMKATLALTEGVRVSTEASALSRAFLSGLFMTKGSFSSYLSGGTEGSFPESSESGGIGPSLRWRLGASVTALREDSLFDGVDIGSDQFGTLIPALAVTACLSFFPTPQESTGPKSAKLAIASTDTKGYDRAKDNLEAVLSGQFPEFRLWLPYGSEGTQALQSQTTEYSDSCIPPRAFSWWNWKNLIDLLRKSVD